MPRKTKQKPAPFNTSTLQWWGVCSAHRQKTSVFANALLGCWLLLSKLELVKNWDITKPAAQSPRGFLSTKQQRRTLLLSSSISIPLFFFLFQAQVNCQLRLWNKRNEIHSNPSVYLNPTTRAANRFSSPHTQYLLLICLLLQELKDCQQNPWCITKLIIEKGKKKHQHLMLFWQDKQKVWGGRSERGRCANLEQLELKYNCKRSRERVSEESWNLCKAFWWNPQYLHGSKKRSAKIVISKADEQMSLS